MRSLLQDVRLAARMLARRPGFTLVAVLTLALGMGANSAIFSVVRAVLLAPLPYAEPDRSVLIWSRWTGWDKTWVSAAELHDYRERAKTMTQVSAWSGEQFNLTGDGVPERVGAARVTAGLFEALGARPLIGRTIRKGEDEGEGAAVAVLSHGLWVRRYGADPGVLGRLIQIDGVSAEVIGVMPPRFRLPTDFNEDAAEPAEIWAPLVLDTDPANRGNHGLYAAARLAPGATVAQATAELKAITTAFTREGLYPEAMRFEAFATSLTDDIVGGIRPALILLAAATAFLLLIACANVANLLLARAETRRREMALRTALGAGRWRLVRQMLVEGLLLAAVGGAAGLLLAWAGVRLIASFTLPGVPRAGDAAIDAPVLLFTCALTIVTSVLCSLVPALRALGVNVHEALKEGAQNATAGVARQRTRATLVVAEMALAVVLLAGAGLALRSLWALHQVDLGFNPDNVLTVRLQLPRQSYPETAQVVGFYRQLLERVREIPGVQAAGIVRSLPLASTIGDWGLDVEGFVETPGNNAKGDWQVVSDGAFEALGERLVAGRWFTAADREDAAQVAVVNETLARRYWADANAVGGRIRMGGGRDSPWITVVGIVADQQHNGLGSEVKEKFYRPHAQFPASTGFAIRDMALVVRTAGDPLSAAGPVRHEVARMDPNLPVAAVRPMTEIVSSAASAPNFTGLLLGFFAALALSLASIGIYGVLSYLVSQRTREIGIRVAVGADALAILRLVLRHGLGLALTGVAIGLVAALAGARVMAGLLYEVQPRDPLTFVAVPLVLTAVAVVASLVPALRATRVDPVIALRSE